MTTDTKRAESQAKAQLDSIISLVDRLNYGNEEDQENAKEEIEATSLSVEVRSDWHAMGTTLEPSEYRILLCTGGPAVQVTGFFNQRREPESAHLEYQDWLTPWATYTLTDAEQASLLTFAKEFYFGD